MGRPIQRDGQADQEQQEEESASGRLPIESRPDRRPDAWTPSLGQIRRWETTPDGCVGGVMLIMAWEKWRIMGSRLANSVMEAAFLR